MITSFSGFKTTMTKNTLHKKIITSKSTFVSNKILYLSRKMIGFGFHHMGMMATPSWWVLTDWPLKAHNRVSPGSIVRLKEISPPSAVYTSMVSLFDITLSELISAKYFNESGTSLCHSDSSFPIK
jgi:hypothetical protein